MLASNPDGQETLERISPGVTWSKMLFAILRSRSATWVKAQESRSTSPYLLAGIRCRGNDKWVHESGNRIHTRSLDQASKGESHERGEFVSLGAKGRKPSGGYPNPEDGTKIGVEACRMVDPLF
jgi:hypothetical protein